MRFLQEKTITINRICQIRYRTTKLVRTASKIKPNIKVFRYWVKFKICYVPKFFNVQRYFKRFFANGWSNSCSYLCQIL